MPADLAQILIAEDDSSSASVLRNVLQRAGYAVTVATDGAHTLRILEEAPLPDLLLLDWMLPGVSGLEICYQVRRRWDPLVLPVLMVTARADAESISAAFDGGASDYLTKPYLGAELRARVAAHLRTKRLVEEQRRIEEHLRERERLASLGLLVSGVAHDLRNPLTGISGTAQLLLHGEANGQRRDDLLRILSEVDRCRRIVGSLLSFARRNPPERTEVDVAGLLRGTFELRERHLAASGITPGLYIDNVIPHVMADGHQLQQAFLNILLNAEYALRHQGSVLQVSARRDGASASVVIEFFNDGPAIEPDVLAHIFTPFFTTKDKDEGTGLGLPICQRIIREHGGEIEVESGAAGTTFRVFLPEGGEAQRSEALFWDQSLEVRRDRLRAGAV